MFGNGSKDEDNMRAEGSWPLTPEVVLANHMRHFIGDVFKELEKARAKFPQQNTMVTLAALTEEVGELNQAILQYNFEPAKNVGTMEIRKEAIQCMVMVMRVLFDTDLKASK